jgi:hypothetical protein
MPVLAVQGFRMLCADLTKFLVDNGLPIVHATSGAKPLCDTYGGVSADEEEEIVEIFRRKGIDCRIKIIIPWADRGYDLSPWVFVCFHWIYLISNKRIDNELNKPYPHPSSVFARFSRSNRLSTSTS